jgi:hypothetical protein
MAGEVIFAITIVLCAILTTNITYPILKRLRVPNFYFRCMITAIIGALGGIVIAQIIF